MQGTQRDQVARRVVHRPVVDVMHMQRLLPPAQHAHVAISLQYAKPHLSESLGRVRLCSQRRCAILPHWVCHRSHQLGVTDLRAPLATKLCKLPRTSPLRQKASAARWARLWNRRVLGSPAQALGSAFRTKPCALLCPIELYQHPTHLAPSRVLGRMM